MFRFEKEPIWNGALELADYISLITAQITKQDQNSLGENLRRAGVTLVTNLALALQSEEGSHESKFYFQSSETTIYKIISLMKICLRREYINFQEYNKVHNELENMVIVLSKLYNRMEI